jgi:peptidoglycan/LPS O-acetylase OafA/YrhL
MASRAPSIPALTGIRPFASALVFGFHFCRPTVDGGPLWLRSLVGAGFVAVSFFFVLSGFILAISHRQRLSDGTLDGRRFLLRRVSRIYPAYVLALALLVPLAVVPSWGAATGAFGEVTAAQKLSTGLLHLAMAHAWWPPLTLSWNLPGWSVSVEIGCYLAFLLVAGHMARLGRRTLTALAASLWLVALAVTIGYGLFAGEASTAGADASLPLLNVLKLWPPARFPEFLFGVALGLCWRSDSRSPRWLAPAALLAVVAALTNSHVLPYAVLHNALLLPAFGALLWSVACARGGGARLLGSRPFVSVGKATYALYILQMPLMYWLLLAEQKAGITLGGAKFLAVFVPLVLAVTAFAHLTVERSGRRLLQRWWPAPTREAERLPAATDPSGAPG